MLNTYGPTPYCCSAATTGDTGTPSWIVTRPLHFYPVVRKEGDEIYIGVMSGGRFKVPVGTVQIRIDQNEAWAIIPQRLQ